MSAGFFPVAVTLTVFFCILRGFGVGPDTLMIVIGSAVLASVMTGRA